jgi:hypothetical protein
MADDKYDITPDDEEFLDKLLDSDRIKGKMEKWFNSKLDSLKSTTPSTSSPTPDPSSISPQNGLADALAALAKVAPLLEKLTQGNLPQPAPEKTPADKKAGATDAKPPAQLEPKKSLFR